MMELAANDTNAMNETTTAALAILVNLSSPQLDSQSSTRMAADDDDDIRR